MDYIITFIVDFSTKVQKLKSVLIFFFHIKKLRYLEIYFPYDVNNYNNNIISNINNNFNSNYNNNNSNVNNVGKSIKNYIKILIIILIIF